VKIVAFYGLISITLLFPSLVFAQDLTSSLEALDALSDGLETSRELLDSDLEACPDGWPCEGYVTSGFGYRVHPLLHRWIHHNGIDIANKKGTPIHVTGDGVVVFAYRGWHRGYTGYGLIVVVRHSDSVYTLYGHLDSISVRVGDELKRGDEIGTMGSTGRSTGPHLHYEIRVDGIPVDPGGWM
jgi:murein DD-endopeptidase MepM/ murein hydrolase activator NlpD